MSTGLNNTPTTAPSTPPAHLDYTRRTFATLVDDVLRYIKRYIPSIQSTSRTNPGIRFLRLCSGVVDVLLRYLDLQFEERSIVRAKRLRNQIRNVDVLNYKLAGPVSATGEVSFFQTDGGATTIPKWTVIQTSVSPTIPYLTLEAASPPGLGASVTVAVIQGQLSTDELLAESADGSLYQSYVMLNSNPVKTYVDAYVNGVKWTRVDDLKEAGPYDQVFEVTYDENMFGSIQFGDNENGLAPELGSKITTTYVSTLGTAGVVDANSLNSSPSAVGYDVTNYQGTTGGSDGDSVDSIGTNAPIQFATHWNAVTLEDFAALATAIPDVYSAAADKPSGFLVNLYVVPVGGGSPSQTLLNEVTNYMTPRMLWETQLSVQGFDLAYMLVSSAIKLKSRQWPKLEADRIIREAVNELLNYTNTKVGVGWAPSDYHALLEGLEGGNLVDVVRDIIFSRVPTVTPNAEAVSGSVGMTEVLVNSSCGYNNWTVLRKDSDEYWVYKEGVLDAEGPGQLDVEYTTAGAEITFALVRTNPGDTIPVGAVWTFSTSAAIGEVKLAPDELPQPFVGVEENLTLTMYYPDEWAVG